MPNLSDGDVISACISKDAFMKASDESSVKKELQKGLQQLAKGAPMCGSGRKPPHVFKTAAR